jgi:hypothetical protein
MNCRGAGRAVASVDFPIGETAYRFSSKRRSSPRVETRKI